MKCKTIGDTVIRGPMCREVVSANIGFSGLPVVLGRSRDAPANKVAVHSHQFTRDYCSSLVGLDKVEHTQLQHVRTLKQVIHY